MGPHVKELKKEGNNIVQLLTNFINRSSYIKQLLEVGATIFDVGEPDRWLVLQVSLH